MLQIYGYISALLSIICILPYIRDVFRLKTKPERGSWFIWTMLGFIAFFSQLAKGATNSLWLTVGQTTSVLIIFLLSLKYGYGGLGKRDLRALIGAGIGLVLWYLTREASFALIFVIIVDSIGTLLTLLKAYKDPESETLSTWIISGTSGIFGMLAVGSLNLILLAYPFYIVLANYVIVGAILLGKGGQKAI
ncbi:hypothetical protein A3H26_01185 [candidate division WWE3 bacterium RIFCSPLOWO2_12_FULL_36_10]|uniref:Uncharacterized protein n=1 Tax=candidate division WWE3 bacterium RIFCSPLOWO2_12_FULL_36_10 TaxID=1802630 RepID=A0A1F4VHX3_UNCKA|nr:MAG: hypothetical protein A3H26_01185 [candidate division WWE3 bacterium RIFCSPLOWO2_12_FULL_36_10]